MWAILQEDRMASASMQRNKTRGQLCQQSLKLSKQQSSRHISTKCMCTHHEIHVQVTMCTKTEVKTHIFQVYIALLWTRTSLNQVECSRKERENAAYSHHHPIEGALTQQITLPIPISYHEMTEHIQVFSEINKTQNRNSSATFRFTSQHQV